MPDEYGGIEVEETDTDEFGGIAVSEPPQKTDFVPPSELVMPQWEPSLEQKLGLEPPQPATTAAGFAAELKERAGDVARGYLRVVPSTLKTVAALQRELPEGQSGVDPRLRMMFPERFEKPIVTAPEQHPLYRAGAGIQTGLEQIFPPPQEPELMRSVGEGIGQVGSMLTGGAAARAVGAGAKGTVAAATTMGATQEFDDAFTRSRQRGDDPDTALAKSLGYATVASLLENRLGAGRILRQLMPAAGDAVKTLTAMGVSKKILGNFVAGGAEEGAQRVAQNWIVEEKPSMEGVMEEAVPGAIVQGILGLPGAAISSQQAVQPTTTERTPDAIQEPKTETADVSLQQPEVTTESEVEVSVSPSSEAAAETRISEPIKRFEEAFSNPNVKISNRSDNPNDVTTEATGLAVRSIDDLDALLRINNEARGKTPRAIELLRKGDAMTAEDKRDFAMASRVQYPREVIEAATNVGSGMERPAAGPSLGTVMGERPLDWKKNPEVRQWLIKNADKLWSGDPLVQNLAVLNEGVPTAETLTQPEVQPVAGAIATSPPITTAPAPTTFLQPKAQREIIADLAKGLKLPIRFGRLTTRKFAGYFKPVANLIGSKKAVDIPTVSHEVGHKLDSTFSLSSNPTIATELDVLGDPATAGSASSWTPSKSRAYKMGEGVAEFVRYWLTDPPKAAAMAPNTQAAFEAALDANKDFGDVMSQAREDIQLWRNARPQARLRSQIQSGNANKTPYTLSQLTRDLVDDLHILRLATKHGAKTAPIDPSNDPYLLARNLRGSYGMADTFVRRGIADFKTKAVRLGTSLEDALKPVAGRLNDFRDWIVAKRAQELISQGRETGLVPADVNAVAASFDADPAFQTAFANVKAWNDALLQYAVDSGLVTPESATAMRAMNQDYVPFHRVFEIGAGETPSQQSTGVGMGLNVGKPGSLKGLKGSTRSIQDPLETMVQNAYTLITASEKTAINRAVADLANLPDMGRWVERVATPNEAVKVELDRIRKQLENSGADLTNVPDDLILSFFRAGRTAPFGENMIRVVRDGKQEFYRLNKDLFDTFKALDLEDAGTLIRILAAPAQLLRSGVVLEPSFNVANLLRDTFSSAVIGKYGALPFETTFKGLSAMLTKPQAVAEWAASGGKNAVEAVYFDRNKLKKFLQERISKDLSPSERALIVAKSPLTALRYLTSLGEEATRIGEYQIALKKLTDSGMPEGEARRLAAFESRDRQDFAKGGAKTKIIRHISAFWNAALQANVKLAQAFKQRPVRTTLQGLAFITIPKLLEQAINWDDDDYWDRPQWERDLFFLIPIGKDDTGHTRFLRLPTPFEVGIIFGTFPGRFMQWMKQNRPDAMEGFPKMMLKNSVPNPMPQAGQMLFEDFLSGKQGWDVWRGRTIVPDSLADLPPDLQFTDQTSAIAKEVGKQLNYSPMKVDHIIERTTGGLGKLATGRSVPGQRFVTAPLRVSNQPMEDFYVQLEKMRLEANRAKLTGEGYAPDRLKEFEGVASELSKLRREIRQEASEKERSKMQSEMLKIVRETMQP